MNLLLFLFIIIFFTHALPISLVLGFDVAFMGFIFCPIALAAVA